MVWVERWKKKRLRETFFLQSDRCSCIKAKHEYSDVDAPSDVQAECAERLAEAGSLVRQFAWKAGR